MKIFFLLTFIYFALIFQALSQNITKPDALLGRWDIEIDISGEYHPAWLEVRKSGFHTLVGRILYRVGSVRPISKIHFEEGKFSFTIPSQWDRVETNIVFEGVIKGDSIQGITKYQDGKTERWKGIKAPSWKNQVKPQWGKPLLLFNGKNLEGWYASGQNQWVVESGILKSPQSGSNLISEKKFTDFKLHVEFRYPEKGNSGVYLRGRYEVQIADSKGLEPLEDQFGSIYGLLVPNEMVAKNAREWQSMDITLIGNRVTVVANGITIIADQTIPGITGGALDSKEGEPGPIMLQGDHEPIEFRNIKIIPLKFSSDKW